MAEFEIVANILVATFHETHENGELTKSQLTKGNNKYLLPKEDGLVTFTKCGL